MVRYIDMRRASVFLLASALGVLQTVALADCRCTFVCRHPYKACGDCGQGPAAPVPDDAGC